MSVCGYSIMTVFLLSLISLLLACEKKCGDFHDEVGLKKNERLIGYTFLSLEIKGVIDCAQECLNRPKVCRSFNVNTKTKICELNKMMMAGESTEVVDDFYFSKVRTWTQFKSPLCSDCDDLCQPQLSEPCFAYQSRYRPGCGDHSVGEICGKEYRSHGCFHSNHQGNGRVLKDLLKNFREGPSPLDWYDLSYMTKRCAALAAEGGYEYFGIEFYGECYGGNEGYTSFQSRVAISECADKCPKSVGAADVMFVYKFQER